MFSVWLYEQNPKTWFITCGDQWVMLVEMYLRIWVKKSNWAQNGYREKWYSMLGECSNCKQKEDV